MKAAFLWAALAFATSTIFVRDVWAVLSFQAAICLIWLTGIARGRFRANDASTWLVLLIPGFGLLQLLAGSTVYPEATLLSILHWLALAGVFCIARGLRDSDRFLDWFTAFAAFEAVLCLAQLHTSNGRVFWFLPSGYDDYVYGTFQSYNNFAQFAELAIPVAIVRGFRAGNGSRAGWYVLGAGLLYAAVIASTSRAGAVLVTVELIAIPAWLVLKEGGREHWRRAALFLAAVPALAVVWTAAAGWERLADRLAAGDLAAGRREFLLSAWDMAVERPLSGHGLGTFIHAYPKFSRIDLPEVVNHAHNDWAEFAAEGGILFPLLVLGFLGWTLRRLPGTPWAWGIAAVLIHACVDFPFARAGVSGWLFVLLGLQAPRVPAAVDRRWMMAPVPAVAALLAIWLGVADLHFVRDTDQSLRRAVSMNPWHAGYRFRLFEITRESAALDAALRLNPRDSATRIEAGLRAEIAGDYKQALQHLEESARIDKGWLPRWTLANFHLRAGDPEGFWRWGNLASAHAGNGVNLQPLFRLASNLESDPETVARQLLTERNPEAARSFIRHVLESDPRQTRGLRHAAVHLLTAGTQVPDRNYVVAAVERFLAAKTDADTPWELWKSMVDRGWLPAGAGQDFNITPPLREGFDWRTYPIDGIVLSPNPGLMTVSMSGNQAEASWPPLQRVARVEPNTKYRLRLEYSTEGMRTPSGLRWRITDEVAGKELLHSSMLATSDGQFREEFLEFTASSSKLIRLQLVCTREPGTRRTTGSIRFRAAELIPTVVTRAALKAEAES
jgi:O-antigen ligase